MFDNNGIRKFACHTCGTYKYKDTQYVPWIFNYNIPKEICN